MKISLVRPDGYATPEGKRILALAPLYPQETTPRPKTRGDCIDGPRPCPWVSCRHHLFLDVAPNGTSITTHADDLEGMTETCSLDVADRGGATQADVAAIYGVKPQSIDEIEQPAKARLEAHRDLQRLAREQGRSKANDNGPHKDDDALSSEGLAGIDVEVYSRPAQAPRRFEDDDSFAQLYERSVTGEDCAA